MRLIDANKLEKEIIWTRMPLSVFELDAVNLAIVSSQDDVKAIPIEWIRKWAGRNVAETDNYGWNTYTLKLLQDWEKESES